MNLQPYQNFQDFQDMLDLLSEGRKANNGSYYVHRGDAQWWLFYICADMDWQSGVHLLRENGKLLGWVLLLPEENSLDVYVQPELRGTPVEHELFAWAAEQCAALEFADVSWVAEDDSARMDWLTARGFTRRESYSVLLQCDLNEPPNPPALPQGFTLRTSRGTQEDARLRSVASYAAFESNRGFEEYVARTWTFMQSPVYAPEHELFVIAPGGEAASFCILWTDALNQVGHFEPVGTHLDFERRGLGRAIMLDGLRRLQAEGMKTATLSTGGGNAPALRLYESVGFRRIKKLWTFTKRNQP